MEPIYFPFTTILKPALAKFGMWDAPLVLYAPTKGGISPDITNMAAAGLLGVRIPVPADEDKLKKVIKAYGDWARQHVGDPGGLAAFKAAHGDGAPFFDDTYIASIRSAIKKYPDGRQSEANRPDNLLQARLFLLMAQQFDVQNDGLDRDFDALMQMERSLYKELKGLDEHLDIKSVPVEDRGARMTDARLSAWSRLFLADNPKPAPTASDIFVTDSPAVFEYLQELVPTLKPVFTIKDSGAFMGDDPDAVSKRKKFNAFLEALAGQPETLVPEALAAKYVLSNPENGGALTIAVAPYMSPAALFNTCLGAKTVADIGLCSDRHHQSTLIGLVA